MYVIGAINSGLIMANLFQRTPRPAAPACRHNPVELYEPVYDAYIAAGNEFKIPLLVLIQQLTHSYTI